MGTQTVPEDGEEEDTTLRESLPDDYVYKNHSRLL